MITKKTFGKQRVKQKRFKSVGDNELTVSDKNFIKNNSDKFTVQQIAIRVGKTSDLVEKFMKKNKIVAKILETNDSETQIDIIEEKEEIAEEIEPDNQVIKDTKPSIQIKKSVVQPQKLSIEKQQKIKYLEANYPQKTVIKLGKDLGITSQTVINYLKSLNLYQPNPVKKYDYSVEEIDYLKTNAENFTVQELAKNLGKPTESLRYFIKRINIQAKPSKINDDSSISDYLKTNHSKKTVREIAQVLKKNQATIRYHLKRLNLKPFSSTSKKDDPKIVAFLEANYRTMTAREMSEKLGTMTYREVVTMCSRLKFIRTFEETQAIRHRWRKTVFDENEVKFVKENHGVIPISKMAIELKRTTNFICKIIKAHGFKITKEQIAKLNSRERKNNKETVIKTSKPRIKKDKTKKFETATVIETKPIIFDENTTIKSEPNNVWVFTFDKKKKKKKK